MPTRSFSWLGSAAAAGWAVDRPGAPGGFAITVTAAAAMTFQSLAGPGLRIERARWEAAEEPWRAPHDPPPDTELC
ncbi:hypothetical protein [Streptomyces sp. NPDC005017]|uniref:hypothetical protein n=1 Tax=Streptomyces sp. NPDC005017 TaxID=3364706 RepID=UPI0036A09D79